MTPPDRAEDVAAVHAVIADNELAFNTNDADLLVAHVADDAVVVGVTGQRLDGRAAMLATGREYFAGHLRDQYARYEVAGVRFPRPDVALAHVHAHAIEADGTPIDVGHTMIALYVLIREDGRWWITARQNTLVTPS